MPLQSEILTAGQGIFTIMIPTVFMNARIGHLPLDVAWALQIATSLAAVAAVAWTYWRRRDPTLSTALLVTASFLVTPYAFNYDMVVFGWVIALLREKGGAPLDDRLALAVWTLPVTAMVMGSQVRPWCSSRSPAGCCGGSKRPNAARKNRQPRRRLRGGCRREGP
jgi:alpha-1,2-mannosyltransferase